MKKFFFLALIAMAPVIVHAQFSELKFNRVSFDELKMKTYALDTSAIAVVLDERAQTWLDITDDYKIFYEYYIKIKILKTEGTKYGDFKIPLVESNRKKERLFDVQASTYNIAGGSIKESKLDISKIFSETATGGDFRKFTLPDVHPGSVIEVKYKIDDPFVFSWRTWHFQSELPVLHSEYHTKIPGNFTYNVTLRGFKKLSSNSSEIIRDCHTSFNSTKWDCAVNNYSMDSIPAFVEEEFMTAKKNWQSAMYFELVQYVDEEGRVTKYTKEWKDADEELRQSETFGKQIKKAGSILGDQVKTLVGTETDELKKANLIYNFINHYYTWDGELSEYTDVGAKKAFETKKGNSADINLSMVGALQEAGLNASPVILSTRNNGMPIELYPVINGFNDVVASFESGGIRYLLDGTNEFLPFGVLPSYCLNGKGRIIGKESNWIELKPTQKYRTLKSIDLTLAEDGSFSGKIAMTYQGYDAISERSKVGSESNQTTYFDEMKKAWHNAELSNPSFENLTEPAKPFVVKADIKIENENAGSGIYYFSPFMGSIYNKNPFTSAVRSYPVDFAAPSDEIMVVTLTLPANVVVDELPKNVALALPAGGGRYLYGLNQLGNKISVTSNLLLAKSVYNSAEYHFLKELFAAILQAQQSQIVLKKK